MIEIRNGGTSTSAAGRGRIPPGCADGLRRVANRAATGKDERWDRAVGARFRPDLSGDIHQPVEVSVAVAIRLDPPGGPGVCLADDGYYWFLYPYLEQVARRTGQMVDPYGDAVFAAAQLDALLAALAAAGADAGRWTEDRPVRLGWRGTQAVFDLISKQRLADLVGEFIDLVVRARQTGRG